jgi:riboflavin synthase
VFTGITRGTFPITHVERAPGRLSYAVALPDAMTQGLEIGASVSIDGVCQTVVALREQGVLFDAIEETLRVTTLDALNVGTRVAVERSFRVGDEIGGHEVSGHVIGTGKVIEVRRDNGAHDLRIEVPAAWMKYIMPKGFIAVDGSSLTVGAVDASGWFEVHLIPETIRLTNLGHKLAGSRVNIELDARTVAIVETVERVLAQRGLAP